MQIFYEYEIDIRRGQSILKRKQKAKAGKIALERFVKKKWLVYLSAVLCEAAIDSLTRAFKLCLVDKCELEVVRAVPRFS